MLAGKYRIDSQLGEGGMGVVYRATNVLLGREVAIKVLRREFAVNREAREKFVAEARAANTVRHPHVVDVLDVVEDDAQPYIVQELLTGKTLADHLSEVKQLSVADTLELLIPVFAAVAHAHERGLLHRDLKPENIFLTEHDGVVIPKLVDFGLSQLYLETAHDDNSAIIAGTPAYMAPEVILSSSAAHPTSDIWALGVVLFECVSGQLPFSSDTIREVLAEISSGQLRSLDEVSPGLPPEYLAIVDKCLQHDPSQRFLTARALLHAAERLHVRVQTSRGAKLRVQRKSTLAPGMLSVSEVRAGIQSVGPETARPPTMANVESIVDSVDEAADDTAAMTYEATAGATGLQDRSLFPGPVSTARVSASIAPARPSRLAWIAAATLAISGALVFAQHTRSTPRADITTERAAQPTPSARPATSVQPMTVSSAPAELPVVQTTPRTAVVPSEDPADHLLPQTPSTPNRRARRAGSLNRTRRARLQPSSRDTTAPIVLRLNR